MKLCIVEDHTTLRDNLSLLLRGEPGFEVAGAFPSGEEAIEQIDWHAVDILLADIDLPGMSGVELIQRAKESNPGLNCMAFTIYEDRATVFSAIKAGACGYLLKGSTPRVLVESLRELHEGGAPMSPKIARKVILDVQHQQEEAASSKPAVTLSEREVAILRQIEQGRSYKEIGAAFHISPHTVHTHIKNIYEKVQGTCRAEVLRKARNIGVL
jgi:two-component system NarL family response regulator